VSVDARARESFKREIDVTRAIVHPNCVRLFDHGATESGFYFVMEWCPAGSVDHLMTKHGGRLPLRLATQVALKALDGLAFAHDRGFVHRDLKPQNILLMDEKRLGAKVSDFGLAKSFQMAGFSGLTATGSASGTFPFMPKEQLTNYKFLKPVSDVWSMAATFYYMVTGRYPRDVKEGQDPIQVILRGGCVPLRQANPSIPEAVCRVIDRALSDRIEERPPTARELREALAAAL
jgi:eukaryotic-like serine/threonine-protein kinase